MAKNEAKIKFTAETGEFNSAIKQANDEMGQLRAELKLNEAQMKSTGASVEALEQQHSLLESQLKASQSKTEALTAKVAKAVEIYGENSAEVTKLKTQLANAQTAETKIRQAIAKCNKELDEQKRAAKESKSATAQLTDKIEEQQSEVDKLKKDYVEAVLQFGKTSKEARDLAREIDDLSDELKQSKRAFSDASKEADKLDNSLDDAGNAAEGSAGGFTIAKGAIADLASQAIQAAIGKIKEFIGWLKELPEATRELRQDMATLETSFETAGFSTAQATNTWKELYKVFGEDDRAVEAANLIAKFADNQKDLNSWVRITKGVWGSYQDSLPVEGLAEAANETAKTGAVTGVLADALNWSAKEGETYGVKLKKNTKANEEWNKAVESATTAEDFFNLALSECSTEQERQQLITETLTELYGGAADKYEEASGALTEEKEVAAETLLVQNELAESVAPLTTAWQGMKNEILSGLLPAVQKFSDWGVSAIGWMKEHPVLMKVLAAVIGVVAAALGALVIVVTAYTIAQWAMNSAILANPITWIIVAIVAAIAAIVAIIVLVIEYWDQIKAAVLSACTAIWNAIKTAWDWICNLFTGIGEWINTNVIQPVANFFTGLWDGIVSGCQAAWDWICNIFTSVVDWVNTNVIQPVVNFFTGLWDSIKNIWNNICNAVQVAIMFIGSIISAAWNIITLPFRFIWENCKQYVFAAWEWIKNAVTTAINAVKTTITNVMNAIKNFLSPILNAIKNAFTTAWNAIKSAVTTAVNAVKSVVTSVWNAIKSAVTTVMNAIKSAITTAWNAIKSAVTTAVNAIKSAVTAAWNAVKTAVTSVLNGIKNTVVSVWNGIKNTISNVVNGIKNTVSNAFNAVKNTAVRIWNGVKNAIMTPINAAKDAVKSAIDKIKGFFDNLKIKFPNIKLPHFKITGKFSLDPPSVPKLGIDWYSKAMTSPMILNSATIFGHANGRLLGGGEAGSEMIGGTNTVMQMIQSAVDRSMQSMNISALAAAIEDLANRPIELGINGRQFALATAGDSDRVNGMRNRIIERGVLLD